MVGQGVLAVPRRAAWDGDDEGDGDDGDDDEIANVTGDTRREEAVGGRWRGGGDVNGGAGGASISRRADCSASSGGVAP
jgi:hypothetical protein